MGETTRLGNKSIKFLANEFLVFSQKNTLKNTIEKDEGKFTHKKTWIFGTQ